MIWWHWRRMLAGCSIVVLSLGMVSADASPSRKAPKRVERIVEAEYDFPSTSIQGLPIPGGLTDNTCFIRYQIGCAAFEARLWERYVTVEIVDDLGMPVPGGLTFYKRDGQYFCGKMEKPVLTDADAFVWVYPVSAIGCTGTATSGKIIATFSNLP